MQNLKLPETIDWLNVDPTVTFKQRKFNSVDFSGRILVGVDFSGSTLIDCDFSNCDLSHANFAGADLYRSKFRRSVLYVTQFRDSNLTRCDFSEAFIYGLCIVDYSNITYAKFTKFLLEDKRRASTIAINSGGVKKVKIGDQISDTSILSRNNYFVNGWAFSFIEFDKTEQHMQRSQVYNRLKRLYQANGFNEEARSCLYWERHYRRCSWYRYHTFTGERTKDGDFREMFRRICQTGIAFVYEQLAGYGLKPNIVLRNILFLYIAYCTIIFFLLHNQVDSGVLYTTLSVQRTGSDIKFIENSIDLQSTNIPMIMYFCAFSMFSLTFQCFKPYGHVVWLSTLFALMGLSLLALLVSALFSMLRND